MKNPVILFADGYELMDSLNKHLSNSGIKTFCAKENISIETIKDLNSQGNTVIGYLYNNIYTICTSIWLNGISMPFLSKLVMVESLTSTVTILVPADRYIP